MKVTLGTFTRSGMESELGSDLAATVRAALSHYTAKLQAGRAPLGPPAFLASAKGAEGDALDLSVDPEVEAVLAREATRQGVGVDALAAHSVLVYLAELDFINAPARLV
jgi:hypothetical protein